MTSPNSALVKARAIAALKLIYIADALAMPVHWFYNPQDIVNAFPNGIETFEAPPPHHPHSFLSLPPASEPQIVGDVILKDKKKCWGTANRHVHHAMRAGENTLNACCARLVTRTLVDNANCYSAPLFLENYIRFMTSETPQHPDTYAEFYHRAFFANVVKGLPPQQCGQAADTAASMGGLVTIAPIAIAELIRAGDVAQVQSICRAHLYLTHPDARLAKICDDYVALIAALLFRAADEDAKTLIAKAAQTSINLDLETLCANNCGAKEVADNEVDNVVIGTIYQKVCDIAHSWPSLLYLAYKYCAQPKAALLANTRVGGENCHRGAVLGVIMGLASADALADDFAQLVEADAIAQEINNLAALF